MCFKIKIVQKLYCLSKIVFYICIGVDHNVSGLCVVGELTHKSSIVVIKLNKSTNDK